MRTVLQSWKTMTLAAVAAIAMATPSEAATKNVMCVKTNTGNYFPVVRISMMVVPDGGSTFEIVLKDGQGEANVQSISFEKHQEDIDLSKYNEKKEGTQSVDYSKPFYVFTNTGKFWKMKDVRPVLTVQEGTSLMTVKAGSVEEKNVSEIRFFRGTEDGLQKAIDNVTGIKNPAQAPAVENLKLMTPISEQMVVSGCEDATQAIVYALDGKKVSEAPVANGVTTVYVGQLPAGVYVLRVGNKALKFNKK